LRLKVLVDARIADQRADWIALVARTASEASKVYRHNFALELSLSGVVLWQDALDGLDGPALLRALRAHPREGADVVLGLVDRPLARADYELAAPAPQELENAVYALVGASQSELPHLPGMLRSLGHLLGAQAVVDPQSEAYRLGSFMRDAAPARDGAVWIDVDNRQRILERKTRPFRAEPAR
jgi:hypothetical protein